MKNTLAMLLAGGVGSRLNVLARLRAKPAVPFGGIYRIIDFTLSNVMNSGLNHVGVLTQYKPYSLMKHIGTGAPWDFVGRKRGAKILPPKTGEKDSDWYRGTADAIAQSLDYIYRHQPNFVLVLSGDHIYYMDYRAIISFHDQTNADITIAVREVPIENAHQFGIAITDSQNQIIDWEEKPQRPKSNLASMGIYVFKTDFLIHALENRSGHDFGKNVIPDNISSHKVMAFRFQGYWQDVGTIQSYWEANMDILSPQSDLKLRDWKCRTNLEEEGLLGDRPPSYIAACASISNSIISPSCRIEGEVVHSILSPGVVIRKGALVQDSVIMHDTVIGENCRLDHVIVDKDVIIEPDCQIGIGANTCANQKFPTHLSSGLTVIGKNSHLPAGMEIGRNCIINALTQPESFDSRQLKCGATI
ncbi:MAG: glucose-1-phosphate adenylyltransferase subunit GlgD [candidate division KSB1 bacterium]|nr:glucose-1-phosphate adenylyltransferase subunit GlgD [candidate division KSB1 bacterium]MDZ7318449.1 glucose-1-phosphate adenylyltransferase subunit GlgD [candidate division KSB1 bacterium]MDZ7340107.1 glucose-1-phosphate adenylyltransferase subunit GlgD [candidate division KSB1 bacterium]